MPTEQNKPEQIEVAAGEKAFTDLEPELKTLAADQIARVVIDVQLVALVALGVARDVESDSALRARFDALANAGEFHRPALDGLAKTALCAWYASHRAKLATATHTEAQLPMSLVTDAIALKERMMKVAEYNLSDHPVAAKIVAALRPGTGHLDVANDLIGLSALYKDYRATVSRDPKHYQPDDERRAREVADNILEFLGAKQTPDARKWVDAQSRAYSLLTIRYGEVAAAGQYLERKQPDGGLQRFPSLIAAVRGRGASTASTTPASPEPAPQPTGGVTPAPVDPAAKPIGGGKGPFDQ